MERPWALGLKFRHQSIHRIDPYNLSADYGVQPWDRKFLSMHGSSTNPRSSRANTYLWTDSGRLDHCAPSLLWQRAAAECFSFG